MVLVHEHSRLAEEVKIWRKNGLSVGFVPTMGALHQGHLSLVQKAAAMTDMVVVSIFVNPAQFGPEEDLDRYPRTLEDDCGKLEDRGVELVFAPDPSAVYPEGFSTFVQVQGPAEGLCGASRPGHFRGVATVCCILFNMARPDLVVMGEKDYQQLVVIGRMVRDLRMGIRVIPAPTVREEDGLAMSSRNAYLSPEERRQAAFLYRGLSEAAKAAEAGETSTGVLKSVVTRTLAGAPLLNLSYLEAVDPETLEPRERLDHTLRLMAAVYAGRTRLIDNIPLFPRRKKC